MHSTQAPKIQQPRIYSVSELIAKIRSILESQLPFVWLSGEISNFNVPASGHYYFTLKDKASQINAVMFRGQNRHLKFIPEDGLSITGLGRISVYEPRGIYQIIFEHLEPKGIGALQIALEQLKERLAAEGLFADIHKKPLPQLPRKIALITSPSGAVVHDMINIIFSRFPNICIDIYQSKVQGLDADKQLVAAVKQLNDSNDADVAIIARGGGSLEDLQAFNSETLARAIFQSEIPIVSAIGHETDYVIADFVADVRAPTPSAAAEMVVPRKSDLQKDCADLTYTLALHFRRHIDKRRALLKAINQRLAHPNQKIQDFQLRLDDLTQRLEHAVQNVLKNRIERFTWMYEKLCFCSPLKKVQKYNQSLEYTIDKILLLFNNYNKEKKYHLYELNAKLASLNPRSILSRGYSIALTIPDGNVVRDARQIEVGNKLDVIVHKGCLSCKVEGKRLHAKKEDL
jgi:exodeoxyribonuclease VII large subunit